MSTPAPILQYTLNNKDLLPAGYTPLAYIESTGTQYIDTGIVFNNLNNVQIAGKAIFTDSNSDYAVIFGSTGALTHVNVVLRQNSYLYFDYGGNNSKCLYSNIIKNVLFEFVANVSSSGISTNVNGETKTLSTAPTVSGTRRNSYLFAYNNGSVTYLTKSKIYYWRIWIDNQLVSDLRSCIQDSNGAIGMYDLVSRTFKTNSGSGSFIAGPELAVGKGGGKSLPEEYLLVEYLESNGSSASPYIRFTDRALAANDALQIDASILRVDNNAQPSIMGESGVAQIYFPNRVLSYWRTEYIQGSTPSTGTTITLGTRYLFKSTIKQALANWNLFTYTPNYYPANCRIEHVLITRSSAAFMNLYSCYRKSDMKPGMYDTVNGVFYTNAGSGEFILGPTICPYYSWEPNAGSGTQQGLYTNVSSVYDSSKGWVAGFNGSNSRIYSSADLVSMFNTRTWSISFWFNTANLPSSEDPSVWKRLILYRKATTSDANTKQMVVYLTKTSIGTSFYGDDTAKTISGLAINTWYHVVITQNGSTVTYYVNGNSLGTSSKNSLAIPTGSYLQIGYDADRGMGAFNGMLSNVQIWNSVLTAAQVKELYGK